MFAAPGRQPQKWVAPMNNRYGGSMGAAGSVKPVYQKPPLNQPGVPLGGRVGGGGFAPNEPNPNMPRPNTDPYRGNLGGTGGMPGGQAGQAATQPVAGRPPGANSSTAYYDQQRNNLMGQYDERSSGLADAYQGRYDDIMGMAKGIGNQQVRDARQEGRNMQSNVLANASARGLSGTTIAPSMGMAAQRNTNDNVNRIRDQNARLQTGLATDLSGDTLGYRRGMESERMGYGTGNIRDSRQNYEGDRAFSEGQHRYDTDTGFDISRDERNFNRGSYEDDRNFENRNYESDRDFQQRRGESDRDYAMRRQMMTQDQERYGQDRGDRLALERLRFMEGRNDEYPGLDTMYNMLNQGGR